MHIGIQNLLSPEQNINISLHKTYLEKFDKFVVVFQKRGLKVFFFWRNTEQQFVEVAKILPSDWLRKIFSIHFVRINKLKVFMGQLPTENYEYFVNA